MEVGASPDRQPSQENELPNSVPKANERGGVRAETHRDDEAEEDDRIGEQESVYDDAVTSCAGSIALGPLGGDDGDRRRRPELSQTVLDLKSKLAAGIDTKVSLVEERLTSVLTTSFARVANNQPSQSAQIAQLTTALIEEKTQARDAMRMESQARMDEGQRLERLIQQRNFHATRGGKAKPADEPHRQQQTKANFKHMGGEHSASSTSAVVEPGGQGQGGGCDATTSLAPSTPFGRPTTFGPRAKDQTTLMKQARPTQRPEQTADQAADQNEEPPSKPKRKQKK